MRKEQEAQGLPVRYDGRYANLSREESDKLAESGKPFVIRMRVPTEGECVIHDMLRGEISIPWETVDMQVLLKTDGLPTYHLANVVDDHLMQISHVIRGEEWINSAPSTNFCMSILVGKCLYCAICPYCVTSTNQTLKTQKPHVNHLL